MSLESIPKAWLSGVIHVLKRGTTAHIRWTEGGSQKFQASFPSDSQDAVTPYFIRFLESSHPVGCPVVMERPAGETWEFWVIYKAHNTHGKILLKTGRNEIIIFSAHLPEKPLLRCERENET